MKYFVVSDIHNYYSLLVDVLKEKGFDESNTEHKLIICGDAFAYGGEGGKTFEYLQHLTKINKLIYIFGNHDLDLVKGIKTNKLNPLNKKTVIDILNYYGKDPSDLNDEKLCNLCKELGVDKYIEENTIPYFETTKYIFVHGFIPTDKKTYIENWRQCSIEKFKSATISDSMVLSLKYGIKEKDKTIVTGHYSTARGYVMENATKEDWDNKKYQNLRKVPKSYYSPFYSDGLILIDGSTKKSGIVNCLVIEDEQVK